MLAKQNLSQWHFLKYLVILNNSKSDERSLTSIQKLLLNSISERNISAQETCYLLFGISLYHSSQSFILLNLNEESARWICEIGTRDATGETGWTLLSPLKKNWNRPEELNEYSLFKLYLIHNIVRGKWKRSKKETIVRIWSSSPVRNRNQWKEFCHAKVILHVSHRSIQDLTSNDIISWLILFN